ncbi:PREDICTED: solute carrier family 2, facilitated glucose transporter member 1-like [Priapulus caudatus]|uniref:Solute carrier family 2, facilitated glucose transporter member 1-like n=1 Tax=Priapulus caudatus TaxID=37621 RepID=A0ABM1DX20_PRICU|nr:PREDICTED: solute carrier family 2, facilitated glucose transporter member 1-like [Priapulus caudatus]
MEGEISDSTLNLIWAITVAIFCVGGVFGGVTTAFWVTRFGRKRTLLANNLIAIIAGALMGLSKIAGSYEMLILGRLLIGLNAGLNSGAGPMYLTEISPVNLRGALGSMHQLVVTISILVSQLLGLPSILGSKTGWPFLLALTIVAAIFQLVTLPFCPESPKYLLIDKQQEGRAQKALITLRNSSEVYEEMDEMKSENQKLLSEPKVAFKDLFVVRALRMPLLITVIMMLSQQLSGINAVMYYSTSIFTKAQLSTTGAMWATIGVGCINVIMTVISVVLVEKAGRRTLHLIGLGGMLLMTVLLTITLVLIKKEMLWATWICVIGVFLFVIFFATGPGSIPWFIAAELFGQGARPAAMTIGVVANWSANFLVGLCFPLLQSSIDQYVFLVFTGSLLFFWLFTYKFVPETKGRPIEEITAMFKSNALGGNSQQI